MAHRDVPTRSWLNRSAMLLQTASLERRRYRANVWWRCLCSTEISVMLSSQLHQACTRAHAHKHAYRAPFQLCPLEREKKGGGKLPMVCLLFCMSLHMSTIECHELQKKSIWSLEKKIYPLDQYRAQRTGGSPLVIIPTRISPCFASLSPLRPLLCVVTLFATL